MKKSDYSQLLAHDIFESDRALLTKITSLDMRQARQLILPHLKRPLDIRKSPYDTN